MTEPSPPDITQMLIDWSNGDREALDSLIPVVYQGIAPPGCPPHAR